MAILQFRYLFSRQFDNEFLLGNLTVENWGLAFGGTGVKGLLAIYTQLPYLRSKITAGHR
ncbi:unnamed protein product [Periconia digitata]|uniref:Uncharacterized protein n=1 Tax=Periconia digitata TaxID=1303443 RepID=A0A9W4UT41_9PLEO|nr:unnamed protein product [Periconia digitata]